tara:strand:- start:422 stop:634 length:213 start_codon:yes stop_codon:yes gene_type:complete
MSSLFHSKKYFYLVLAFLSTLSLITIAGSLLPISFWAHSQNQCIESTFRIGGRNKAGLPSKVWSCNGGGD